LYEKEGLVVPFRKSSKHRLYSKSDIDRIECIRRAISEKKMSIYGILAMYSLIPCWDIINCSQEERNKCEAYASHSQPCWTYQNSGTKCEEKNCRDCTVYINTNDLAKMKDCIKNISRNK